MVLQQEEIWERLQTRSVWVDDDGWESLFPDLAAYLPEHQMRYVTYIGITGNRQNTVGVAIRLSREGGASTESKFSPIPVAPADFVQIPPSHSIVEPIAVVEGGGRLEGQCDVNGHSVNVTMQYWDYEI